MDLLAGEIQPHHLVQEGICFLHGEAQILEIEFTQLSACPQTRQG
jgi:hypothetical protein